MGNIPTKLMEHGTFFFLTTVYGASENIHVNGAWEKGTSIICFHDQFSNIDQFVLIHKAGHADTCVEGLCKYMHEVLATCCLVIG